MTYRSSPFLENVRDYTDCRKQNGMFFIDTVLKAPCKGVDIGSGKLGIHFDMDRCKVPVGTVVIKYKVIHAVDLFVPGYGTFDR